MRFVRVMSSGSRLARYTGRRANDYHHSQRDSGELSGKMVSGWNMSATSNTRKEEEPGKDFAG